MLEQRQETLTVTEVRHILGIGANSAYALIHSNAFPVVKIGHAYRVPREAFYAWLNQNSPVAAPTM